MKINISKFSLDIFRDDIKENYKSEIAEIFQDMCFDLISYDKPNEKFIPFQTKGKDGSTDHYGFNSLNENIIIECKKNDTYELSKSALSQLSVKLNTNLAKKESKENLYKPWFNTNFKHYYFCTSANFPTANSIEDFKKDIDLMFIKLSKLDGLSHLKNVKVELYTWNNLKPILEKDTLSYFKWMKQDIFGIEYLSNVYSGTSEYKHNLYEDKQNFISRVEYNNAYPNNKIRTEDEIFNSIFNDNSFNDGLLIHGKGGVGKTRLMLELGKKAQKENWIVFKITKKLNSLKDLDLAPNQKICLLFDYIEENKHFETDILDTLREMYKNTKIKIIANSRSSYLISNDIPSDFDNIDISENKEYTKFITEKILSELNLSDEFKKVKPSFAVFIKEDYSENIGIYKDFKKYLMDRLRRTLNKEKFVDINDKIFSIFSSLPLSKLEGFKFDEDFRLLKRDGWIDDDEDEYSSEHDSIIDELIELYLEQTKFDKEEKKDIIKQLINSSLNRYSAIRTFDRISEWLFEKNIANHTFFLEIFKEFGYIDDNFINLIIKTSLLNHENRFELFINKQEIYTNYIKNYYFIHYLSFVMNQNSKNNIEDKNLELILNIWIENNKKFIPNKKLSYKILSTSFNLFGLNNQLSIYLLAWLKKYPLEMESHFIIKSWLDAGGEKEEIKDFLLAWLEKYPLEMETDFIMRSWLDAGGEKEEIKDFLLAWLKKYPLEMESHFIIKSWLDAGGEKEEIKDYLLAWLKKYSLEMETSFILQSWLDAGGEKEEIKDFLLAWLEKYPLEMETSFILQSWLDAGGEKEEIKDFLLAWLEKYPLEMETSFILQSWLDAGGEKEEIKDFLLAWLEKYPLEMETSFILKSWLDAGGEKEEIKDFLLAWLEKYPLEMETSFILKSWLDAGGEKEEIKDFLLAWLKNYSLEMESHFIIKSWLDAGGEKEEIKDFLLAWLKNYSLEMESHFIIKSWLDAGGEKEEIKDFLLAWLKKHIKSEEASFVIKVYINKEKNLSDDFIQLLFEWIKINSKSSDLDFVLKRLYKTKIIIPEDINKIAFRWCNDNIKSTEVLIMLNYMSSSTKHLIIYQHFVPKVLRAYIDINIDKVVLQSYEVLLYNVYQYNNNNINYLLKEWLLSEKSFNPNNILDFIKKDKHYFTALVNFAKENNFFTKEIENKLNRIFI